MTVHNCKACRESSKAICTEHRRTACRYCGSIFVPHLVGVRACKACRGDLRDGREPRASREKEER